MKFGIVIFPGSNCDHDCFHIVTKVLGQKATFLWHKSTDLEGSDCILIPGGFSYGDYLRSGAVAAKSPIMDAVRRFASRGGLILGICNGFQILQEAGLLPGVLMRNKSLTFICKELSVHVENNETPFTKACSSGEVLRLPIAHMDGSFFADRRLLTSLKKKNQILFRYDESNPNGSMEAIAGIMNEEGNVCGLMPHPERCSEELLGNQDGVKIFHSIVESYVS